MSARPRQDTKAAPTLPSAVPLTPGLAMLINDDVMVRKIHRVWPDIEKILLQIQRDSVKAGNTLPMESTLLALRENYDTLQAFAARGEAVEQALKNQGK